MASNNPFAKYVDTASNGVDSSGQSSSSNNKNNPFIKYTDGQYTAPVSQQTVQPQQEDPNDQGAFMAGVDQLNRAFGRVAEGAMGTLAGILGNDVAKEHISRYQQSKELEATQSAQQHPTAALTGGILGNVGAGIAYSGGAGKGLLETAGKAALTGFGLGALSAPVDASASEKFNQGMNTAGISAAFGGGSYLAAKGISAAVKDVGGKISGLASGLAKDGDTFIPKAKQEVDYSAGQLGEPGLLKKALRPKKAAAEHLAMKVSQERNPNLSSVPGQPNLTPGEAIGGENMREFELRTMVSDKTKGMLNARQQQVTERLTKDVQGLLDDMTPEGAAKAKAKVKELYSGLKGVEVDQSDFDELMTNPSIADRFDELKKNVDASAETRGASDKSLTRLDAIKQHYDKEIFKAKNPGLYSDVEKVVDEDTLKGLNEAKNSIITKIEKVYPQYKDARKVSERVHIQDMYLDGLKRIKETKGDTKPTLNQVYNKMFGSVDQRQYFLENVKRTGGNVENAENIIDTLSHIKGSPVNELLKKSPNTKGVYFGTSPEGIVQQMYQRITEGFYNKELVKLMLSTDGKWQDTVTKIMYNKNPLNRAFKLGEVLKHIKTGAKATGKILTSKTSRDIIRQSIGPAMGISAGNNESKYGEGNINLLTRPQVKNKDGSVSTVKSASFNIDGKEVLLPTVSDDGKLLTNQQAVELYKKTGKHLGKFNTIKEADAYAEKLHKQQERLYSK